MKFIWLGVVVALLFFGVYAYRLQAVPPDCSSPATISLVRQILIGQFKYQRLIRIANIRTSQGGMFAPRFECDASIEGDLSGQSFGGVAVGAVHYTSEITEDTHRHYVTAKPQLVAQPER